MKNPKITLTKDGLLLIDEPEKPVLNDRDNQWYKETGGYKDPNKWYTQALEKSINEGVKFKEPEQVIIKMPQEVWELEQGKLYDIPEGYQIRILDECDCPFYHDEKEEDSIGCRDCADTPKIKYAVLEPLTKQEPKKTIADHMVEDDDNEIAKSLPKSKQLTPNDSLPMDFVLWYSGMSKQQVLNSYQRFISESLPKPPQVKIK